MSAVAAVADVAWIEETCFKTFGDILAVLQKNQQRMNAEGLVTDEIASISSTGRVLPNPEGDQDPAVELQQKANEKFQEYLLDRGIDLTTATLRLERSREIANVGGIIVTMHCTIKAPSAEQPCCSKCGGFAGIYAVYIN
jgi:hypothetical protein